VTFVKSRSRSGENSPLPPPPPPIANSLLKFGQIWPNLGCVFGRETTISVFFFHSIPSLNSKTGKKVTKSKKLNGSEGKICERKNRLNLPNKYPFTEID